MGVTLGSNDHLYIVYSAVCCKEQEQLQFSVNHNYFFVQ
jgi:hypothetical protein